MSVITNDPFLLQREVKKAYMLRQKGLLDDKEFADAVGESIRKTTSISDWEMERA